jgi:hypothetical protein
MTKGEEACVSLKDHFDAIRAEQDKRIEQALTAAKEAVTKAEQAQERRLNLLNEFRAQSVEEGSKYFLITSHEQYSKGVDKDLREITKQIARLYGGIITVGAIGLANLVKLWLTH